MQVLFVCLFVYDDKVKEVDTSVNYYLEYGMGMLQNL